MFEKNFVLKFDFVALAVGQQAEKYVHDFAHFVVKISLN